MVSLRNLIKNDTFKKGAIFTFFAALNNGLNFLLIFILSVYLSKNDFGVLNLFNTFVLIVTVFISLSTQSYFSVTYFKKSKEGLQNIFNAISIISLLTFIFFIIIILLFSVKLSELIGFSAEYQIYAIIICFLQLFYTLNLEIYRLEEKPVKYGVLTTIWLAFNFLTTLYFCISLQQGWAGRANAQIISAIVFFIFNIYFLRKKGYLHWELPDKNDFTNTLKFGLPLIPHNSTIWIRQGLDRYFLNFFYGSALVGSFSFAYNFAGIIMMVGTAFNATNSVYIFKNLKEDNNEQVEKKLIYQIKIMSILFFIITLFSILISFLTIKFVVPKYNDAIPFLLPMCLMGFFQCIYYLFVNFLFFYNKTKTLMYITFSISIVHLLLSFILTRYSSLYTAYIGLLSGIIICLLVIWQSNKVYPLLKLKKGKYE